MKFRYTPLYMAVQNISTVASHKDQKCSQLLFGLHSSLYFFSHVGKETPLSGYSHCYKELKVVPKDKSRGPSGLFLQENMSV